MKVPLYYRLWCDAWGDQYGHNGSWARFIVVQHHAWQVGARCGNYGSSRHSSLWHVWRVNASCVAHLEYDAHISIFFGRFGQSVPPYAIQACQNVSSHGSQYRLRSAVAWEWNGFPSKLCVLDLLTATVPASITKPLKYRRQTCPLTLTKELWVTVMESCLEQ
jgi:hypothetical protein